MFQEDWLMRQIQDMVTFILRMLKKDTPDYERSGEAGSREADLLYDRLNTLVRDRKIAEADALLQEAMDAGSIKYFELAVDFYSKLNLLDDGVLESCGYSRKDAEDGLRRAAHLFGLSFL